jgi:predicted ester cyclase
MSAGAMLASLIDAVSSHDAPRVRALLAPELHTYGIDGVPASELTDALAHLWQAFPDLRLDAVDIVGGDGLAWGRIIMRGHHTGPFQGRPATGREIEVSQMMAIAVRDERIVAHDISVDRLALQQQLGWIAPTASDRGRERNDH